MANAVNNSFMSSAVEEGVAVELAEADENVCANCGIAEVMTSNWRNAITAIS